MLYEPKTSISITDLKAFTEIWLIEARKLPAAPALDTGQSQQASETPVAQFPTYITKSIAPSSFMQRSTEALRLSNDRTSTAPIPITLAPGRAVARSCATFSVFSTFLPTMQALAPKLTRARTCALQIVPAPPVQKTTLFATWH